MSSEKKDTNSKEKKHPALNPEKEESKAPVDYEKLVQETLKFQSTNAEQILELRNTSDQLGVVLQCLRAGLYPGELAQAVSNAREFLVTMQRGTNERIARLQNQAIQRNQQEGQAPN